MEADLANVNVIDGDLTPRGLNDPEEGKGQAGLASASPSQKDQMLANPKED